MDSFRIPKENILELPTEPGVYKFFDQSEELIYVGKAKSLKKRVSSYFTKSHGFNRKTIKLVEEIKFVEFTIVNSEFDALLLENNLIKNHQPKYNILYRDDKSYPYVCVAKERFPRIYSTRRLNPEKGEYFGPFSSVKAMNNVLRLIRNLYHIRTCSLNLSESNISAKKFKSCLEFHIGNCKAPCEGLQSEEEYMEEVDSALHILKGNLNIAKLYFKTGMQKHSALLDFENAQKYKVKLELLEKFQAKSLIVNQKYQDIDVFTILSDDKYAYVNYLKIKNGGIHFTKTVEAKKQLDETDQEILSLLIFELRKEHQSITKEIVTNILLDIDSEEFQNTVPKIGDKKKLIQLSYKNALSAKEKRDAAVQAQQQKENRALKQLKEDLQLKDTPRHIECFDNSNFQGSSPVASMVCFKNGKPSKKDYRKFNIKTVEGIDDFASMKEVVGRRYSRLIDEASSLPQLIVIDGGKGQLNAAVEALQEIKLYGQIPIIGIAKRLEEIYTPGDEFPLHIDKKSESLKLIQHLRNEAHRFAITFHRDKRSKKSFKTALSDVKGLGPKTIEKLLSEFKSLDRIKNASREEVQVIIGKQKAEILISALNAVK